MIELKIDFSRLDYGLVNLLEYDVASIVDEQSDDLLPIFMGDERNVVGFFKVTHYADFVLTVDVVKNNEKFQFALDSGVAFFSPSFIVDGDKLHIRNIIVVPCF